MREITESALMSKSLKSPRTCGLWEIGVGLAVDDFGTGYHVSYLPLSSEHPQDRPLFRQQHGEYRDKETLVRTVIGVAES